MGRLGEAPGIQSSSCVRDAEKTVGYSNLQFRASAQARDVHLGINNNLRAVDACMNEYSDSAKI